MVLQDTHKMKKYTIRTYSKGSTPPPPNPCLLTSLRFWRRPMRFRAARAALQLSCKNAFPLRLPQTRRLAQDEDDQGRFPLSISESAWHTLETRYNVNSK